MERKNYSVNKITRFILPFIIPDKTLLSEEFGFINAYTRTILNKTTIMLVFKYDLTNHYVLHEVLEALDNFKGTYFQNISYEIFELSIPEKELSTVSFILDNNVYGLLSENKLKIINFWKDFSLSHLNELLKDMLELDVLNINGIRQEIYEITKGID